MLSGSPRWQLTGFLEALDNWIARESPPDEIRRRVTAWILTRFDDPYEGVRRESGFANLWFGAVPGSTHSAGLVVACAFWIEESTRVVRCDSFASLSWPL